jgi:hypothetical protein
MSIEKLSTAELLAEIEKRKKKVEKTQPKKKEKAIDEPA